MIWNKDAIDYSKGITIKDLVTGTTYTETQAKEQPLEIRRRLVCVPNVVGCWVLTLEEAEQKLTERRK